MSAVILRTSAILLRFSLLFLTSLRGVNGYTSALLFLWQLYLKKNFLSSLQEKNELYLHPMVGCFAFYNFRKNRCPPDGLPVDTFM